MIYFNPDWWTETFGIPSKTFLPAAAAASAEIKEFLSSVPDGEKEITETGILSILTTAVRSLVITENRADAGDDKVHTFRRTISTLPETHRSIDEYAEDLGISKYELIRKYAKTYGLTPHADKINMRIQRAILLFESPLSMTEIAYECGFSDQSHFIRCFKQYSGMQPGEYRNAILSNSH